MYQVTVDYAKINLDELCDRAGKESEGVAIVCENRSYVLITHEEWESLIETAELVKVPNLLEQVKSARQEYQKRRSFEYGSGVWMTAYKILFSKQAQKDIGELTSKQKEKLQDILTNTIAANPYVGKPLKGELSGLRSYRLNRKDRLVYEIYEETVSKLSAS